MVSDEFGKDTIRLLPPGKTKCPLCADRHTAKDPHNRNSLYYQMRFLQDHERLPTWGDAMENCSPFMRAYWRNQMIQKGVKVEETMTNDGK